MDDRALPAIARCAMQPTWADAHKLLVCLAADAGATLPPAGVAAGPAGSAAKAGEAGVWAMKRAMARSVADALAAAGHEPLRQAWWLLSLDPRSKTDMSEGSSAIVLATAVCSDTLLDETARAWQALANAAGPDADPDPIAAAHRLRSQERAQSTPSQAGILDGLPFLVAAQPSYEKAKRVALFAANEMLDAIEYAGTLRGAFAEVGAAEDPVACATKMAALIPAFFVAMQRRPIFAEAQLKQMADVLNILATHRDDPIGIKHAAYIVSSSAEDAVRLGIAPLRRAQAIASAWHMSAHFEWPIGKPTREPDEVDLFVAAHRLAEGLLSNMGITEVPPSDPEYEADGEPEDATETGAVVVLGMVGGVSTTTSAKEAASAFCTIAGMPLPRIRVPDLAEVRARLRAEFPHLAVQIDTILADVGGKEFVKLSPLLLVSGPGAGKTRFARRLAEHLDVPLHRYDGAGASDNAFSGTGRRWSSGEPSVPLEAVRITGVANPIVLVDEIDKSGTSRHHGSLGAAMLPFLDAETAARYPDPYALSACDLSNISYIATANDDAAIPPPLRDRFRVLHLPLPDRQHLPELARGIVGDIAAAVGDDPRWFPDLNEEELMIAERLWPGGSMRRLKAVIERLIERRGTQKN